MSGMTIGWRNWGTKLGLTSSLAIGGTITLTRCCVLRAPRFANALGFAGALWAITLTGCFAIAFSWDCAKAQIAPDATLGSENSRVTSTGSVDQIEGGATRGANLFHSFQEFNVGSGRSAFFTNPPGIENILTRVTGANPSHILGTLGVSGGNANLFLINPNGIVFGRNSRLSLNGSFVASTASSLNFADGTQFNATAPQTKPLLTVSVPIGLQFGSSAGSILNQSRATNSSGELVGLQVQPGKTLALVGGDVTLQGGAMTAAGRRTAGGRIELGSVAGPSLVSLNPTDKGWTLGYGGVQNFQNIQLSQRAVVDASGSGGGDIQVQGKRVTLTDGSQIAAKTLRSEPGGTLTVTASDFVEVSGESANPQDYSRLTTRTEGAGDAGNLTINTGTLIVEAGAQVTAGTWEGSRGDGGTLTVNASGLVKVSGASADGEVLSRLTTRTEGAGDAGNLTINTGTLIVEAGGQISAGTLPSSRGDGGTLTVTASDLVKVSGASANREFLSRLTTRTEGAGDAGNLTINTGTLIVEAGGQISAGTLPSSRGDGGTLTVTASDLVKVSGASPLGASDDGLSRLTTRTQGAGDAGNLRITTAKLVIENGAQVSAGTNGRNTGDGGSLTVTASDSVQVSGASPDGEDVSRLTARTESGGDARNLTITTGKLVIENGAQVSAGTFGEGQGGTLTVTAWDSVQVSGFVIDPGGNKVASRVATRTQGGGDARALTITTGTLIIRDEAQVDVRSFNPNSGKAGNLEITARSIRLDNQGKLTAETASGDGGNIILRDLDLLLIRRNSQISTTAGTAKAPGDGGNITINARNGFIVAVPSENSDITANAFAGRGGTVQATAQGIFGLVPRSFEQLKTLLGTDDPNQLDPDRLPSSDITAISQTNPALSGQVTLNTLDVDPSRGLVNLPVEPVNTELAQGCHAGDPQAQSSFVVTGRGGLPPNPKEALSTDAVEVDLVRRNPEVEERSALAFGNAKGERSSASLSPQDVSTNSTRPAPTQLVEAQGWVINDKGEVVLTATAPTITPHSSWHKPVDCRALQSQQAGG